MAFKLKLFFFFSLLLSFLSNYFLVKPVFAHPADQIFFEVKVDSQNPKHADSDLYLSWQQLGYVLDKFGDLPPEKKKPVSDDSSLLSLFKTYKEYDSVFTKYISQNLTIKTGKEVCKIGFKKNDSINEEEIVGGKGYKFILDIDCPQKIDKSFYVINNLYVKEYPYQTIFVELKVNDKKYTAAYFKDDTEGELIQNTKNNNGNSLNSIQNNTKNLFPTTQSLNLETKFLDLLKSGSMLAFVILFLIGSLHTLEAGHSKAIIFSIASNKDTSLKQGLYYVLIFTITHVADILVLAVIFILLNSTVDIYKHLPLLTTFSLYTLLFFSIYMLVNGIKGFIESRVTHTKKDEVISKIDHTSFLNVHGTTQGAVNITVPTLTHTHGGREHTHAIPAKGTSLKKQLAIGFLAGLAPCFMGWSIFLVILTSKNLIIVIPLILCFALGIAFTLSMFLFITLKLKKPLYSKFSVIGDVSPIISGAILFFYAIFSLIKFS